MQRIPCHNDVSVTVVVASKLHHAHLLFSRILTEVVVVVVVVVVSLPTFLAVLSLRAVA
jgi:hypothetical protein